MYVGILDCTYVNAQTDTLFFELPSSTTIHSSNVFIIEGHEGVLVSQFLTDNFLTGDHIRSLVEVDKVNGDILFQLNDVREVDSALHEVVKVMKHEAGYFLLISCFDSNNIGSIKTYSISKDLNESRFIDEAILGLNKDFWFNSDIKKAGDEYEVIGRIQEGSGFCESVHMRLSKGFEIESFTRFQVDPSLEIILDFVNLNDGNYLVPSFGYGFALLNEDFEVIDQVQIELDTFYNNQNFNIMLRPFTCTQVQEKILCSCHGISGRFALIVVEVEVKNDSIQIVKFHSGLQKDVTDDFNLSTHSVVYDNQDLVFSGTNLGDEVVNGAIPNHLLVSKLNEDAEVVWNLIFENGSDLLYWDHFVDENGDVFVSGRYSIGANDSPPFKSRNFILKVFEDGTLSFINPTEATKDYFQIYPNPASDHCFVKSSLGKKTQVKLYSNDLKLLYTFQLQDEFHLDTSNYPSGMYFLIFENDQGLFTKKLVKK